MLIAARPIEPVKSDVIVLGAAELNRFPCPKLSHGAPDVLHKPGAVVPALSVVVLSPRDVLDVVDVIAGKGPLHLAGKALDLFRS